MCSLEKAIVLAWIALSPLGVSARTITGDWIAFGNDGERNAYIERNSWRVDSVKRLAVLLTMEDFPTTRQVPDGKEYHSESKLFVFDCANRRAAVMAYTFFSGPRATGSVVRTNSRLVSTSDFHPVTPGTLIASLLQVACSSMSPIPHPRFQQ